MPRSSLCLVLRLFAILHSTLTTNHSALNRRDGQTEARRMDELIIAQWKGHENEEQAEGS